MRYNFIAFRVYRATYIDLLNEKWLLIIFLHYYIFLNAIEVDKFLNSVFTSRQRTFQKNVSCAYFKGSVLDIER